MILSVVQFDYLDICTNMGKSKTSKLKLTFTLQSPESRFTRTRVVVDTVIASSTIEACCGEAIVDIWIGLIKKKIDVTIENIQDCFVHITFCSTVS